MSFPRTLQMARTCQVLLLAGLLLPGEAASQAVAADTVSLTDLSAGRDYRAGGFKRWLFGSGYRGLWRDSVPLPEIRLPPGTTAVCSPQSLLTDDLRLITPDGRVYRFRTYDKLYAQRYLPAGLDRSPVGVIVQDLASGDFPVAGLTTPPLYQAAGVPAFNVSPTRLTDSLELGGFLDRFSGAVGTLGADLDGPPDQLEGIDSVITTQQLWERMRLTGRSVVDVQRYLRARLLDLLLGDWGSEFGSWRWIQLSGNANGKWVGVPWDRNHAFSDHGGIGAWYGRFFAPELIRFQPEYPSVFGAMRRGLALDRRILPGLPEEEWRAAVQAVTQATSDSSIAVALSRLPDEWREIRDRIELALVSRRDQLAQAAREYRQLIDEYADIHATDLADRIRIIADSAGVTIELSSAAIEQQPLRFVFEQSVTRELRLYLNKGRDSAVVLGELPNRMTLRIVGDPQLDRIDPAGGPRRTSIHDLSDEATRKSEAEIIAPRFGGHARLLLVPREAALPACETQAAVARDLSHPVKDFGSATMPIPALGYASGLGFYAGLGGTRTGYAFGKQPFASQFALWGGYASSPNSFFVEAYGDLRRLVGPVGLYTAAGISGVNNPEFYGFGNETVADRPDDFYRVDHTEYSAALLASLQPNKSLQLAVGPGFTHTETKTGSGNVIDSLQPFGTGVVDEIGLKAWVKYDTFNRDMAYASGLTFNTGTKWMRATGGRSYQNLFMDLRGFMSWSGPGDPTLALRAGGEWVWGQPPYYRSAFLSGSNNLKGYPANRFGGDGSLFLNSELRLKLAAVNWPFPFNFGILGIADVGRVFLSGESSQRWHTGVGGGVWFGIFSRGEGLALALVEGEGARFYLSTGFITKTKNPR